MKQELKRFVLIGITNTIFYYLLYAIGIYFGLSYQIATLIATLFGVLFSFKTFGRFVFNNTSNYRIFRFFLSYTFLYFVNISIITMMKSITVNYYFSGFVAVIICALLSFILNKFYVYK